MASFSVSFYYKSGRALPVDAFFALMVLYPDISEILICAITKGREEIILKTELQSNVLTASTVRKVLPSCLVFTLVQSMTFMVDPIISGHFLGSNAVAAVALGMPLIGLMISFSAMILHGGFLKMLSSMGRCDMEDYRRIASITIIFTLLVDLVFLAICLFCTDSVLMITGALKASPEAVVMGRLYLRTACWMILLFGLGSALQLIMTSYGYQAYTALASCICVIVNVVASVIFMTILSGDYRIAGIGLGSALGTLAQTLVAYFSMRHKKISIKYRIYPPNKKNIADALDILRRGFPASADNMLDSICGSVVNNIILSVFTGGTAVLALVTIIKTILSLVRTVGRGVFTAGEPIIGILHGSRDNEGIKKVFHTCLRIGLVYASVLAAILIALQTPLLRFYNISDNPDGRTGLIMTAISGLVYVVIYVFDSIYEATGRLSLAMLFAVVPDSILYPLFIPVLSKHFGITGIWMAMGYAFIPFFIVFYLIFAVINRKFPVPLERLLALKKQECPTELDVSIPTDAENISFVSENIQKFYLEHGAPTRVAYLCALCMEEIAADYLAHRAESGTANEKSYMDIKAFHDSDKIEIVLRNYDEPYNPLVFETDKESFSKIGVTMVQRISKEIKYSYAFHLNVVSAVIKT